MVYLLLSLLCVFYVLLQVLLQLAIFFLEVPLGTEVTVLHFCLELLYSVQMFALGQAQLGDRLPLPGQRPLQLHNFLLHHLHSPIRGHPPRPRPLVLLQLLKKQLNNLTHFHPFEFLKNRSIFDMQTHFWRFLWLRVGLRLIGWFWGRMPVVERILLIKYFRLLAVDRLFMFFDGFEDLLTRLVYVGNFHY